MQAISYKRIWIWIWIGYISKLSFGYRIWIYILFKIEDMDMILYPKKNGYDPFLQFLHITLTYRIKHMFVLFSNSQKHDRVCICASCLLANNSHLYHRDFYSIVSFSNLLNSTYKSTIVPFRK